jgi:hypothetical protein
MLLKKTLGMSVAALVLSSVAWGGTITDPAMGLDSDSFSSPISSAGPFIPINGGGIFGYFNDTGHIITELIIHTTILPGLSQNIIDAAFACQEPTAFFLHCSIGYQPLDGLLTISFFGVNPPDGDNINEQEGIPPIPPNCTNPESGACGNVGHFVITLNDGFATTGEPQGGWSFDRNPELFNAGGPSFNVAAIVESPEPSALVLLGSGVAALLLRRRVNRRAH